MRLQSKPFICKVGVYCCFFLSNLAALQPSQTTAFPFYNGAAIETISTWFEANPSLALASQLRCLMSFYLRPWKRCTGEVDGVENSFFASLRTFEVNEVQIDFKNFSFKLISFHFLAQSYASLNT